METTSKFDGDPNKPNNAAPKPNSEEQHPIENATEHILDSEEATIYQTPPREQISPGGYKVKQAPTSQ